MAASPRLLVLVPYIFTAFVTWLLTRAPARGPDAAVADAVECLRAFGTYKDGCWWRLRRETMFATLEHLASLPPDKLDEFSFASSAGMDPNGHSGWASMDLLAPTFECDWFTLRKLGGKGDGAKWMCGGLKPLIRQVEKTRREARAAQGLPETGKPDCVVYSLGSQGRFQFEETVRAEASKSCEIHTFDCTGQWSNPASNFHRWCVGPPPEKATDPERRALFMSLNRIAAELNHTHITLLKMDVEGAEYAVFEDLLSPENSHLLPIVIWVELHTHHLRHLDSLLPAEYAAEKNWARPLLRLARKLDRYGYALAAKERNEGAPSRSRCCSEYVFIRIKEVQGLDLRTLSGGFGELWRSASGADGQNDDRFKLGYSVRYPPA
ncbi:methyltransferase domain-containing protein [Hyaloraphidium curvatum]|nr:methyltransferase domain-containing protein [Hyaloraphidium curvatum]